MGVLMKKQKRNKLEMSHFKYISIIVTLILLTISTAGASIDNFVIKENTPDDPILGFSKIYVDGFSANSNGFKLILRTYERHQDTSYQPFLADIEYILMTQGQVIYSKRVEQVPLSASAGSEGIVVLDHRGTVALEEDKNYTGLAKVYLYRAGNPEYYLTISSNFTAKSNAEITEVYGDGLGASATIKGTSMVPLNAKIIFTLKQDGKIIETKEIAAPPIMSSDKEKTVNILWTNNLNEGTYMASVLLEEKDLTVNYDKIFTVDKKTAIITPVSTIQSGNSVQSIPGFTLISVILVISALVLTYKRRS